MKPLSNGQRKNGVSLTLRPENFRRSIPGRRFWLPVLLFLFLFVPLPVTGEPSPGRGLPSRVEVPSLRGERRTQFSLAAVGDVLIHKPVYEAARSKKTFDFRPYFRLVKNRVSAHDLAFCNQETILGGVEIGLSSYPCFNSPIEVGDAIIDTGFDLVSLANNHTLDRGEKGVVRSLKYWSEKTDILTSGSFASKEAAELITVRPVNGTSCAFLAYTTLTNGLRAPKGKEHYVSLYSKDRAARDVKKALAAADVVLVSMHWGSEYTHTPTEEQRRIAGELASLGVHIVIGHHPHVVQPVEMVKDTLVIFSLGNFISAQKGLPRLVGLLVSLDVAVTSLRGEKRVSFENVTATLLYNPSRSPWGRYTVIPFDCVTEKTLPDFHTVYGQFIARVKGKGKVLLTFRAPGSPPEKKKSPPQGKKRAPKAKK
ncbi:MAG: CapA family protein [Synergistaceae bacterium]|nr:CapA family protein [Synergistaceae bacterium]